MKLNAYAKINLYLDITAKLSNGYHALHTVMQSVSLCDELTLEFTPESGIVLTCSNPDILCDQSNTAFQAAALFYKETGLLGGVKIEILKNIPVQAGLGGGSADAAAVLYGLNRYYGEPLSEDALLKLASKIGADVPFCLLGGTRLCTGIGDKTAPVPEVSSYCVLCKPSRGVSTQNAYSRFDSKNDLLHNDLFLMAQGFGYGQAQYVLPYSLNLFEQLVDIPEGENIKRVMLQNSALHAALTGSGSSYFGMFDSKHDAERCLEELKRSGLGEFLALCRFIPKGVEILE